MVDSEGRQPRDQANNQSWNSAGQPGSVGWLTVAGQLCLAHWKGAMETLEAGPRQSEKMKTRTKTNYHTVLAQAGQAFSPYHTQ